MRRVTPTVFQILAKTHRITIFLSAPITATIDDLKKQALPALEQYYSTEADEKADDDEDVPFPISTTDEPIPKVKDVSDFEFCKTKRDRLGKVIEYDVLESKTVIREKLSNWEVLYFRFRDESGELQDVHIEEPVDPDEVDVPDTKGKRKEPPT